MSMISEEPKLLTFLYLKNGNTDWAVNAGVREERGRTRSPAIPTAHSYSVDLSEGWALSALGAGIITDVLPQ